MEQERNSSGQFVCKSGTFRRVRSIRISDTDWLRLQKLSEAQGCTVADLLHEWLSVPPGMYLQMICADSQQEQLFSKIKKILHYALTLKSNAGGAIKTQIREVLDLLPATK